MTPATIGNEYLASLDELAGVVDVMRGPDISGPVLEVAQAMLNCVNSGGCVYWFGNGGSATDASHLAAEFVGRCAQESDPWPSHALGDSSAAVTALANDYGYDEVFSRQVRAHVSAGDVVVGLTTSGRSTNVIRGLEAARARGALAVALTGVAGLSSAVADVEVRVPSATTARIQEMHKFIGHFWATWVEEQITASGRKSLVG